MFTNPTSTANPVKYIPIAPKPPIVTVTPLESNPVTTTETMSSPTRKDGYVVQPTVHVSPTSPAKLSTTVETVNPACKPRRGGSLELFYRKVISKEVEFVVITYTNEECNFIITIKLRLHKHNFSKMVTFYIFTLFFSVIIDGFCFSGISNGIFESKGSL